MIFHCYSPPTCLVRGTKFNEIGRNKMKKEVWIYLKISDVNVLKNGKWSKSFLIDQIWHIKIQLSPRFRGIKCLRGFFFVLLTWASNSSRILIYRNWSIFLQFFEFQWKWNTFLHFSLNLSLGIIEMHFVFVIGNFNWPQAFDKIKQQHNDWSCMFLNIVSWCNLQH